MTSEFRLIILGGGSAAFAAATRANDIGIKTAMINHGEIGGTCVNVGCVPSKHLLEVGNLYKHSKDDIFEAIEAREIAFDFRKAIEEKRQIVEELRRSNYQNVVEYMRNLTLYEGKGRLVGRDKVEVDGRILEGEKILIAVGARPYIPPFKGVDSVDVLTNEEMLELEELPESLVVIGGRALGLEFAQMYSRFGSEVTVLQRSTRILPDHEPEVSEELTRNLMREGIEIHTGVKIERFYKKGDKKLIKCVVSESPMTFEADQVLMATGRRLDVRELGLDTAGVEMEGHLIKTNEYLQTTNPDIYAAGDCASKVMLETLAARMGNIAVRNALEGASLTINPKEFPSAVFTDPEVATVGYTEEEFSAEAKVCACRTISMELVPKAKILKDTRGIVKMVIDPRNLKVGGVHIVAPMAADMIHEATLAVKFGLTIDDIIGTPHVFPTVTEAIKKVAHSFRRDVSMMSCCIE